MMPAPEEHGQDDEESISRRDLGRLPKGMRTPNREYEEPILHALVELGGKGRMSDVLASVEKRMKPDLNDIDFQPLLSDPDSVRWRNTAQWTRFTLVQHGDLKPDSPRGVWEITQKGRQRISRK